MSLQRFFVTSICLLNVAYCYPGNFYKIDETKPECTVSGNEISCDFEDSDQDMVLLDELPGSINKIIVKNVRKLHLRETVCAKIFLMNIKEVLVIKVEHGSCPKEFNGKESTFDTIPRQFSNFFFKDCNISSFSTDAVLMSVEISSSRIGTLDIHKQLPKKSKILFRETTIDLLQKMILGEGSTCQLLNTKLRKVSSQGFIAKGATINMKNTTVEKVVDNSFNIQPNVTLYLDTFSGNLGIKSSFLSEPGQSYFVEFLICLVLLVLVTFTFILFLICHFGRKCRKGPSGKRNDTQDKKHKGKLLESDNTSKPSNTIEKSQIPNTSSKKQNKKTSISQESPCGNHHSKDDSKIESIDLDTHNSFSKKLDHFERMSLAGSEIQQKKYKPANSIKEENDISDAQTTSLLEASPDLTENDGNVESENPAKAEIFPSDRVDHTVTSSEKPKEVKEESKNDDHRRGQDEAQSNAQQEENILHNMSGSQLNKAGERKDNCNNPRQEDEEEKLAPAVKTSSEINSAGRVGEYPAQKEEKRTFMDSPTQNSIEISQNVEICHDKIN